MLPLFAHLCDFCGDEYQLEILEVYADTREFEIITCCEESHEEACLLMSTWDSAAWQQFFHDQAGMAVRRVHDTSVLDYGLEVAEIPQSEAKQFVLDHHRHNRPPAGWKFGAGLYNGSELVAVLMVGRPVARLLNDGRTLEVNRLCVKETMHEGLTRNACSMLYGFACRKAAQLGYKRVVTYTLASEAGSSLKAANFTAVAKTRGGSWHRAARPRTDKAPTGKKIRWERIVAQ